MSHKAQRRRNASRDKEIGRRNAVRPSLAPLLVIVVALAAYANAWPNALVHDDKFFRSSSVQDEAIPGVGLGLAITKKIVDAHEGQISVQSRLGEGTTFEVRLPLTEPPTWPSRPGT